jgi:N-acetylmuramate 1-kinase
MNATKADDDCARISRWLEELGLATTEIRPLAGDASARRFYRVVLRTGGSAVATLYAEGSEAQARHDAVVQRWGRVAALPIPALLVASGRLIVSEDLGARSLAGTMPEDTERFLSLALEALGAFQSADWKGAPNPPFDADFFRRELQGFEVQALRSTRDLAAIAPFLDALALRVSRHPYRLVHRDFHVDNLLVHEDRVRAVDFQDMRGGPDTYDVVSLLGERALTELLREPEPWFGEAARRFGWASGWRERVAECRMQRGLKVLGTFHRLAAAGRREYLRFVPGVVRGLEPTLAALEAPEALLGSLAGMRRVEPV